MFANERIRMSLDHDGIPIKELISFVIRQMKREVMIQEFEQVMKCGFYFILFCQQDEKN